MEPEPSLPLAYVSNKASRSSQVVDVDEVRDLRQKQIVELSMLLAVPETKAETLLRASGWNLEAAALKATDALGSEAPVVVEDRAWKREAAGGTTPCAVCYESAVEGGKFETDCGSVICIDCWHSYLQVIIASGATVVVCPMPSCRTVVSLELVTTVLSAPRPAAAAASAADASESKPDAELLRLYCSRRVSDYVTGSSDLRACPGRDCESIVKRIDEDQANVECSTCQTRFCWKCNFEDHWPLDCSHAADWILRATSETKSQWWIVKNTKLCPGCRVPVNKNGGCPHMHCSKCGMDWDWQSEKPHKGNPPSVETDSDTARANARRAELRVVSLASEKHMLEHRKLVDENGVAGMMELGKAFGLEMELVKGAISQILSTHRELRWIHMARYFKEMTTPDKNVLEVTINQLEEAVGVLKILLLDELQLEESGDNGRKEMQQKIRDQTARVAMFRRVIESLCGEFF